MSSSETIKRLRINLYLEQEEFGRLIGVSAATICNYERGFRRPRMKTIRKIKELAEKNNIEIKIEDFFDL